MTVAVAVATASRGLLRGEIIQAIMKILRRKMLIWTDLEILRRRATESLRKYLNEFRIFQKASKCFKRVSSALSSWD